MSEPSTIRLPDDVEADIGAILAHNGRYKSRSAFLVDAARALIARERETSPQAGPDPTFYVPFRVGFADAHFANLFERMTMPKEDVAAARKGQKALGLTRAEIGDAMDFDVDPIWMAQAVAHMSGLIGLGVRAGEPEWMPLLAEPRRWCRMCNLHFEQVAGKATVLGRNLCTSGGANVFSGNDGVLLANWSAWENPRRIRGGQDDPLPAGERRLHTPGLRQSCVVWPVSSVEMAVTAVGAPGTMAWFRVGILAEPAGPHDTDEPDFRPVLPGPYARTSPR